VRGDLDAEEARRLREHLAGCDECAAELAAEEALTHRLRTEVPRPNAPEDLRAAVESMMRRQRPVRRATVRRVIGIGAAAAAAVIAIALVLGARPRDPIALATRHAADTYTSIDQQRAQLGADSANTDARLRDLTRQYGIPAATAFHGDDEVRLVSVRQGSALGKTSAVLVYLDRQGRVVTLEVLPGGDVTIPKDKTRPVKQFRPMLTRAKDLGVALWRQGPALYLLTAPLDEQGLADLYLKVRLGTS
jgi:anti-sigma factor RsiW